LNKKIYVALGGSGAHITGIYGIGNKPDINVNTSGKI
jgi:hypothetical protein